MRENCPHHLLFAPNVRSSSSDNQINVRAPVREREKNKQPLNNQRLTRSDEELIIDKQTKPEKLLRGEKIKTRKNKKENG